MTGRPWDRKMEMNGGSTASYLARTLYVPVFLLILLGLETNGLLDFQRRRGTTSVVQFLGPSNPKLEKESENEFPGPLGSGVQNIQNRV